MSLFSFLFKKTNFEPDLDKSDFADSEEHYYSITGTNRDFSSVKTYDIALKIWLPEATKIALQEMCSFVDTTMSDIIRQTLFTYLYGRYDLMASIERGEQDFNLSHPIRFSRSGGKSSNNNSPELGKNRYDVKVWIATRMKNDLQLLADKADVTLSEFVREILISNLFGHTYFPERNELLLLTIEFEIDSTNENNG